MLKGEREIRHEYINNSFIIDLFFYYLLYFFPSEKVIDKDVRRIKTVVNYCKSMQGLRHPGHRPR